MKAYFFDLDGTLVDTEVIWCGAVGKYLNDRGCRVTYNESVALVYGRSWNDVYRGIKRRFPDLPDGMNAMQLALENNFYEVRTQADVRIPGSVELLKRLSAQGKSCCVVSGSPRDMINDALRIMRCTQDIEFYIGSEDYTHGKPAPDCFLLAAHKLKVPPAECVVFEDSEAGVRAGKAAGMYVVALNRPNRPKQNLSPADLILENLSDFQEDE